LVIGHVLIEIIRDGLYRYRGNRDEHEAQIEDAMTAQLGSLHLILEGCICSHHGRITAIATSGNKLSGFQIEWSATILAFDY
jgi:hypothetical protein